MPSNPFLTASAILLLSFSAAVTAGAAVQAPTYRNPILPGFHPDPSICRAGEDYYLTSSTFEYFPGLPIYHSKDLVHWELIGNALDRPSQLDLKMATDSGGLYAPTIRHHQGLFYLTCTNMSGQGGFIVTAKDPAGPWSEPMWTGDHDMDGSMLFDDDGKAYYTKHAGGQYAGISQAEFDPKTGKFTTPLKVIYNNTKEEWNEGPHLYKIKGLYYLMLAEGGTGDKHQEVIGRSKSPWGPFEPCPHNPILSHRHLPKHPIQCTGHADLVEASDGSWWAVFLGVRHNKEGVSVLGRQTYLAPVEWTKDGWPRVNGGRPIELEMPSPKLPAHAFPAPPAKDAFDKPKLGPDWIHARNPDPADFALLEKGGLRIRAARASLSKRDENPAFAGQRQPDFLFRARTAMEFKPEQAGEEAGLCVRANDENHYEVGVELAGGKPTLFVRNTVKGERSTVASAPLAASAVQLELAGDGEQYQFSWSGDGKVWTVLAASPAGDLSRDRAGGFTGAVIGLYASANGKPSGNSALFKWFEMEPGKELAELPLAPRPTATPVPPQAEWRIRCGGSAYTDAQGRVWMADHGFRGGDTAGTGRPIKASADAPLYQLERWGKTFSYVLPVLPGSYSVTLKFAETYLGAVGERVFDVKINGREVLNDFDIMKAAGGRDIAVDRSFSGIKPGKNGAIELLFEGSVQNAKVAAIEVVPEKP